MSEWLTESEAAAALGTSVKTISRYVAKGLIEVQKRPRPGKKPQNVCNRRDVEHLKPATHVMPEAAALVRTTQDEAGAPSLAPLIPAVAAFMQTISTAIGTIQTDFRSARALREKLWLTLEEGVAYSGLAKSDLRGLCRNGTLTARKSGGWKILRKSLEGFDG